ncbi:MAG: AraC family transcriptional regulator [Cyanobacteria bacterium P01_C01_bin.118]
MTKILMQQEVDTIIQECRANGHLSEYTDGLEHFTRMPAVLGQGWFRFLQVRQGLNLTVTNLTKRHIHLNRISQHASSMPLTFCYYLAGGCGVDNDGLSGELEEVSGKSYLYRLPNTGELEKYPAEKHLCRVHIQISPELIYGFSDRIDEFPTALRNTLEHPESELLYHPSPITSAQRQILQQILEWPYQGLARHLYLESKVLELIALRLNQMLGSVSQAAIPTNRKDIDSIYTARDILIQNMAAPPCLSELAQQVGLTEIRLTRGFRQVFNTSVFNYLHDYRMEQAQQLLQAGSLNVQEVARSVGYTRCSSFSTAFKKKFGVTPSIYLKKTR